MQTTNNDLNARRNGPEWYFLGEYPLKVLLSDAEMHNQPEEGLLSGSLRYLGIEAELLNTIERQLIGYAEVVLTQLKRRRYTAPAFIRLFCNKKTIETMISMKPSVRYTADQGIKSTHIIHQSDYTNNGEWGYFLVERGGDLLSGSGVNLVIWIDVYLYKEGE